MQMEFWVKDAATGNGIGATIKYQTVAGQYMTLFTDSSGYKFFDGVQPLGNISFSKTGYVTTEAHMGFNPYGVTVLEVFMSLEQPPSPPPPPPPPPQPGNGGTAEKPGVNVVAVLGAVAVLSIIGYGLYRLFEGRRRR